MIQCRARGTEALLKHKLGYSRLAKAKSRRGNILAGLQEAIGQEVDIGRRGQWRTMDKIRLIIKNLKCQTFFKNYLSIAFCVC